MDDENAKQAALGGLRASGFPFQMAVADLIRNIANCRILDEEFSWQAGKDDWRFLDIVADKSRAMLAIECKKTQKETYTFLKSSNALLDDVSPFRCAFLVQIDDSSQRLELFSGDWYVYPASGQASFCVVSTSASGDRRMLEPDARNVVNGAVAYAKYYRQTFNKGNTRTQHPDRVIIPMIVTNAQLYATSDRVRVSLESGELPKDFPIEPVPWIRFRKTFGAENTEMSVFVVRSTKLEDFLEKLFVETASPSPRVRIPAPD